jgi:hypothetical protein
MKKKKTKDVKEKRGTSTSLLISIGIHVVLFLLAGLLVVFTVVKKEEQVFEPPQTVDRPKMKLKKPKVKVKRASKPKSASRITANTPRTVMPSIDLPELGGMGSGLGGDGLGGFSLEDGVSETTIFGSGLTIGNDFVGTFYDLKRDMSGNVRERGSDETKDIVSKFTRSGFKSSTLAGFYRSPKKLYATCFMVPTVESSAAPKAFGEDTGGWTWLAHYKGNLVHKDGITFRFRGQGDDILIVMVAGEIVLDGSWPGNETLYTQYWQSSGSQTRAYQMGNNLAVVGDWITLEPGVPLEMEVIGGEVPGGEFDMMLVVEEKGVEYPLNAQQGPILPMFKTAEPTHALRDIIYKNLVPGEASVTNGPVFNDFGTEKAVKVTDQSETVEEELPTNADPDPVRNWVLGSGESIEGEMVSFIADQAVVEVESGKQIKIPFKQLSAEDQEYVEMLNPPECNITFTKQSNQTLTRTSPLLPRIPPREFDWTFGVKINQKSTREYSHELSVEYFAVGSQLRDSNKFILFARDKDTFTLAKKNQRSHQFKGEQTMATISYDLHDQVYGEKYKGYLVLIRDKQGEIIQHAASNEWLYENREELMKLPVGSYFDKSCTRVHPTSPDRWY